MSDAFSAAAFAPSELVILFGDRFVPEAGMLEWKEEILTSGARVGSDALMNAAVRAALFAVHRSGAATLQAREGKALLGLVDAPRLFLLLGTGSARFPAGSLEAYLVDQAPLEREVTDLLKAFIEEESDNPSQRALGVMKRGMSERGLLEAAMKKSMLFFATVTYVLPAATRMAAAAEPLEPVQALLREFAQREPELDAAVRRDIDAARAAMTGGGG